MAGVSATVEIALLFLSLPLLLFRRWSPLSPLEAEAEVGIPLFDGGVHHLVASENLKKY